ncbi:MAG: hypothetical protein JXR94_16690 [Candidatus Hydrogenedentes bacterium]|nr:hypothetical protein [Candidatus Hydrogenedentota bacterium]
MSKFRLSAGARGWWRVYTSAILLSAAMLVILPVARADEDGGWDCRTREPDEDSKYGDSPAPLLYDAMKPSFFSEYNEELTSACRGQWFYTKAAGTDCDFKWAQGDGPCADCASPKWCCWERENSNHPYYWTKVSGDIAGPYYEVGDTLHLHAWWRVNKDATTGTDVIRIRVQRYEAHHVTPEIRNALTDDCKKHPGQCRTDWLGEDMIDIHDPGTITRNFVCSQLWPGRPSQGTVQGWLDTLNDYLIEDEDGPTTQISQLLTSFATNVKDAHVGKQYEIGTFSVGTWPYGIQDATHASTWFGNLPEKTCLIVENFDYTGFGAMTLGRANGIGGTKMIFATKYYNVATGFYAAMPAGAIPRTMLHEWGHNAGLLHVHGTADMHNVMHNPTDPQGGSDYFRVSPYIREISGAYINQAAKYNADD